MQRSGAKISYYVTFPERGLGSTVMRSARWLSGRVFPRIMAQCPICMSTAVVHRSIVDAGMRFPVASRDCDTVLWATLAREHAIASLDTPLSVVQYDRFSAPVNLRAQCEALRIHIAMFRSDPRFSAYPEQIEVLEAVVNRKREIHAQTASDVDEDAVRAIFGPRR